MSWVFCPLIKRCVAVVLLVGSTFFVSTAPAATSTWFEHDHGAVRLIYGGATTINGETRDLGLQFRMKPGWKVYWRSPGDAGFPPQIDWSASENFANAIMSWPAPERFSVLGLETLGYKQEVVFPIKLSALEPSKALALEAQVRFLTCDDICVPYEITLALNLPAGTDLTTRHWDKIKQWQAKVPLLSREGPLSINQAEIGGSGKNRSIIVRVAGDAPLKSPDLFIEGPSGYSFDRPEVKILSTGTEALMRVGINSPEKQDLSLVGKAVTLTLVDGNRAVERRKILQRVVLMSPGVSPDGEAFGYGFLAILGLAIVGGLILNLMPCVLPVLSLKLLTISSYGGEDATKIRKHFIASAGGVITCFLVLGTLAVALRSAGLALGWGIQFQQPAFIVFMVVVITLFACNMWGLFEFRLPGVISNATLAKSDNRQPGLASQFMAGAFATLLATPCTAPFLGTAIGFALSRGPLEIYSVFFALGIGLAMPWIAVAVFPQIISWLPKPGRWMIVFKRILSMALIGTALWLLTVIWSQIGGSATGMVALLMVAIIFIIWQHGHISEGARFATWVVVSLLTVMSMVGADSFAKANRDRLIKTESKTWREFDLGVVAAEIAKGNTVFIDVTADWCLTCQVNKSLVLNRGQVANVLGRGNFIAMKADWTNPNPEISAFLKNFGRYGIPFNVVFGPLAPEGLPLPEILSEDVVLTALAEASGRNLLSKR